VYSSCIEERGGDTGRTKRIRGFSAGAKPLAIARNLDDPDLGHLFHRLDL
jgi:hypothetical protein